MTNTGETTSSEDIDGGALGVTVVVCAYTEERWPHILAALDSVLDQNPPASQVVLSVDNNPELAERARKARPSVTVVENREARGVSGARNAGLRAASEPIIAYLDDDAQARPGWLKALIAPLDEPQVMGTAGQVQPLWERSRPSWLPPEFDWVIGCTYKGLRVSEGAVRNPIGGNMSMRVREALEAGGYDARVGHVGECSRGGEETDLSIRLTTQHPGSIIRYVPEAIVDHFVGQERLTIAYFLRRCWQEGLSKVVVVELNGSKGLESERRYVMGTLPSAIGGNVIAFVRGDRSALTRLFVTIAGLSTTAFAYLVALARSPSKRQAVASAS